MKSLYAVVLSIAFLLISTSVTVAQGCIAVRHMSSASSSALFRQQQGGKWFATLGYRNLHSYKHFVGTDEQKQRVAQGTNVINDQNSFDLGLAYQVNTRFSVAVNLPFSTNARSSLYEHYGNDLKSNPTHARFSTHSQGIGDARLTAYYWLVNPAKLKKFNVLMGLGVKLPTGNSNVQDNFHRLDKDGHDYTIRKAVDQSIQLGDKGVGINVEMQGYWQFSSHTALYANGFYLLNPRETNNTLTRGTLTGVDPNIAYMSVADQFAARLGLSQTLSFVPGLSLMLGGRVEGIPAHDLIGGSRGFRRPGYIVSVEPGLMYARHKYAFSATVPVAIIRNRTKSYADLQDPTGQAHGDAAFADYFASVTLSRWF